MQDYNSDMQKLFGLFLGVGTAVVGMNEFFTRIHMGELEAKMGPLDTKMEVHMGRLEAKMEALATKMETKMETLATKMEALVTKMEVIVIKIEASHILIQDIHAE